jgi:hypothetical protein
MVACANHISSRDPGVLAIPLEVTMSVEVHDYPSSGSRPEYSFQSTTAVSTVSQEGKKTVEETRQDA